MLKRTQTYTDYNGNERTEDFWFNLTDAELAKLMFSKNGGLDEYVKRIVAAQDLPTIINMFEQIVLLAYGQKSIDGKRFIKNDQLREEFAQTEAYSQIFMELAFDDKKAAEFVAGIVPAQRREAVQAAQQSAADEFVADNTSNVSVPMPTT